MLAAALAGCGSAGTSAVRIDPALATLVPADTTLLAGVRMDMLRDTAVYRKWVAGRQVPILDDLARQTGLDLRKDLWELLLAGDGTNLVALARGQFSERGLEPRIERQGLTRTPYKGYTLIGNEDAAVVFMNSSTAVAGPPAAVRHIIDNRDRAGGVPPALRAMLRSIPTQNQVWVAAAGGFAPLLRAVPHSGNAQNLGRALSMIESFTAAADLRSGLNASLSATCHNGQDAKSLGDVLRGLLTLARLSTPDNQPDLARAYDDIQVAGEQRTLRIDAVIPGNLLDSLLTRWMEPPPPRRP